ncbi:DEAD/DEAH box helicase family protein [Acidianus sp. HS-5]|uniref:DEAD/DEAH box helicase family protein n=1 Tax=Acidianus sp. HS-5 TaxID=2886040 RepID=UPI001F3C7CC0|nr:DEAD/DEAH box helicase family protein [Acidianus sp. HS-5]BDC18178.1 helicase [Acidianus sp. HS-5]
MVRLSYYKGLIVSDYYAPGLKWNDDFKKYIGFAYKYRDVLEYFKNEGVEIQDEVLNTLPFPVVEDKLTLRDYQAKALFFWNRARRRGIVVLPTGAGKTSIGIKAIAKVKASTIIIVPTIDLLDQWYDNIQEFLNYSPGRVGGGYDELKAITVITYDSAYTRVEEIGNKFAFVIFDEVHHLPSEGYSQMAQMLASPYRLGLTATPEREDSKHRLLPDLVGPIVFRLKTSDLAGKYLAEFEIRKIYVSLTDEEKNRYDELRRKLKEFLASKKMRLDSLYSFHRFVKLASRDQEAREALLAWHNALRIAVNSRAKIEKLRELLNEYDNEKNKIIIFTRDVEMAYSISREFLIPVVTYKTSKDERSEILRKFKEGKYSVIVASSVFDEGVDVPDANIGILLGGYGTSRQMLQRLGRILRKKEENNKALLIEIITKGTSDYNLSKRRHRATV